MSDISRDFWLTRQYKPGIVSTYEDEELYVTCIGCVVLMPKGREDHSTVLDIAHKAIDGQLNYNDLHGFYKIVIYMKQTKAYMFWGDNQGSQVFFVDERLSTFSDGFLSLRDARQGSLEPCFESIAQLLSDGYVYNDETVIKGIYATSLFEAYRYENGVISCFKKNLSPFSSNSGHSLHDIIIGICKVIRSPMGAVCTGGTDSRTVLAHLKNLGITPKLVLTAHEDNPDVSIVKKVAKALGTEITILDPSMKESGWLKTGFDFSDGLYEPILAYRHYANCKWANEKGVVYEFGGVGGEFYKNAFFNRFLFKAKKYEYVKTMQKPWMGSNILNVLQTSKAFINSKNGAMEANEDGLLHKINSIGFVHLAKKAQPITNMYAESAIKVDPLMDRDVIALASKAYPVRHAMALWQRKEIHKQFPILCNIPTDQGYSCSVNPLVVFGEGAKKFGLRTVSYVKKRIGVARAKGSQNYWISDYEAGRNSLEFDSAFAFCKSINIIKPEVGKNDLPPDRVGDILMIGMLFEPAAGESHK